jgi:hypothetical protein
MAVYSHQTLPTCSFKIGALAGGAAQALSSNPSAANKMGILYYTQNDASITYKKNEL